MIDKEKLIRALECHVNHECQITQFETCPYWSASKEPCSVQLSKDAIALIKEQEQEINFLKAMQSQTVKGMDELELGNIVGRTLGILR